jgi:hypothetical protein
MGSAPYHSPLPTVEARNMWRYTLLPNASTKLCFNTESNNAYRYQHVVKTQLQSQSNFQKLILPQLLKKFPKFFLTILITFSEEYKCSTSFLCGYFGFLLLGASNLLGTL